MKKSYMGGILAFVGILTLLGAGCQRTTGSTDATESQDNIPKIEVAATVFPVYDMVRNVGKEHVQTHLILSPGVSPHIFEPTPSILKKLANTKLVFAIGVGLDNWVDDIVKSGSGAKKITLERNITLHEEEEHEEEEEEASEDEHGEFNPHYWLSPANAIAMVQSIEEELSALDPTNATAYKQNAQNYIAELRAKDTQWKTSITSLDNKNIVTFHDAFGYFAEHFGLSVLATFEEFPGKEPTPQYLARLQEDVKEHNVKTMYLEPQLAVGAIKSFAKDQNVELGILDPLGGVDGRNSYIELIDYNVQTIVSTNK